MEIPDTMISDSIKKLAGYKFYMAKKVESENAKIVDKLEEKHASLVKSGKGKGFICYGDQVVNAPNKLKKDVLPRKTRSFTIVEETVVGELAHSIGPAVYFPAVQSLLDLRKGSKVSRLESLRKKKQAAIGEGSSVAHNKHYVNSDTDSDATLYSSSSNKLEKSANETDDADKSDTDLSDDNPDGDDDAARCIPSLMQRPILPTSVWQLQEMFLDENAHHLSSPPAIKMSYPKTNPQPNSLQTKAKKLMQKAKKNMRKINFKKAVAHKFREYDQKLEALINFNVSEAFERAC
ncbi:hypothetical protein Tco_1469415 [Tanacetum coccineum]